VLYQKEPVNKLEIRLNYKPITWVYETVYYAVEWVSMIKQSQTHLGRFLSTLREQRGYESIQEYVRHYQLPVSYVYYTEIESGKKRLSLETSKQLYIALEADQTSFYYHLLRDILPDNIQTEFLNRIPIQQVLDKKEKTSKAQSIKEAYQKNQLSRLNRKIVYVSDEADDYLKANPLLNSLISAIYCVPSTSDKELEQLAIRLGISDPIEAILSKFEELELIKIVDANDKQYRIISRLHDIVVTNDRSIFAKAIESETRHAVTETAQASVAGADQANCFYGMIGLTKQKQEELRMHIADLDAEFDAYHLKDADGMPQLMTIVFSPAREYSL